MPLTGGGGGGTVYRSQWEYPTVDVPLLYLYLIGKADFEIISSNIQFVMMKTVDSFTDKAVESISSQCSYDYGVNARYQDFSNLYGSGIFIGHATQDFNIRKLVGGNLTLLASQAIDLSRGAYLVKLSANGSTLKAFRTNMSTPILSATDTSFSSGKFGAYPLIGYSFPADLQGMSPATLFPHIVLRAPSTPLPTPEALIEFPVRGTGKPDDPIVPAMQENLVEVPQSQVTAEEWRAVQSNPKGPNGLPLVNTSAVSWGAVDYKTEPTMLCAIFEGSPSYLDPARVSKQAEYARSKRLMVEAGPFDTTKTKDLHKKILKDRKDMLITENELTYQLIGAEELEVKSIADFYEREVVNLKRIDPAKIVDFDQTIDMWIAKAQQHNKHDDAERLKNIKKR